jgi:hypothetical protein
MTHVRSNERQDLVDLSPKARRFLDAALAEMLDSTQGLAIMRQALVLGMLRMMDTVARDPADEDAVADAFNDIRYLHCIDGDLQRALARLRRRSLSEQDAAVIKAMLAAGLRQSDIAALFGVNSGRITEINTGRRFAEVRCSPDAESLLQELRRLES